MNWLSPTAELQLEESADALWYSALQAILKYGQALDSREGESLEIIGWQGCLRPGAPIAICNPGRKYSATYAGAEVLWYLRGDSKIDMPKAYAPSYDKWANDGEMAGAVGGRLSVAHDSDLTRALDDSPTLNWELDSVYRATPVLPAKLEAAIELLLKSRSTRRCVISLWSGGDLVRAQDGVTQNVPCYLTWQLFVRDGMLHWITTMRSQDAYLGMPYDVFAFACIQRLVAAAIGVEPGVYLHQCGSLHLYQKHLDKVESCLMHHSTTTHMLRASQRMQWDSAVQARGLTAVRHSVELALSAENAQRAHGPGSNHAADIARLMTERGDAVCAALLWCASRRWDRSQPANTLDVGELLCPALGAALVQQELREEGK